MTAKPIEFVRQEDETGCNVACLAMVMGTTYQQAKEFCGYQETGSGSNTQKLQAKFLLHHEDNRLFHYAPPCLVWGRIYWLGVPSLNVVGRTHAIIVDWRTEALEDGRVGLPVVLDPQGGNPGKRVYGHLEEDEDFTLGYSDTVEIMPAWAYGWDQIPTESEEA